LLVQNPRGEIDGLDVGAQFTHDRTAPAYLFGRLCETNPPSGCFLRGHDVFHRSRRAEIKRESVTKNWSPVPICRNVFPL
jgi:hypothetical protein